MNPNAGPRTPIDQRMREWEQSLGVEIRVYEARGPDDFDDVFAALARTPTPTRTVHGSTSSVCSAGCRR